jgi:hypothetical protein
MIKNYLPKNIKISVFIFVLFTSAGIFAQVPVVKFGAAKRVVEQYEIVELFDSSSNNPTQWEWNIYDSTTYKYLNSYPSLADGSVRAVGTGHDQFSKDPEFSVDIPGLYTVTLRCKNSAGWSNVLVKKAYIKLALPTQYSLGYGVYGQNNDNIVDSEEGSIFDNGGPNKNYDNDQGLGTQSYLVIKPCSAKKIILSMTQLRFSNTNDVLYVYDADKPDNNKLLAAWTKNNTSGRTVTALSGKMYIKFESDGNGVDSGFAGTYTTELDTSAGSPSVSLIRDSIVYNSVPVQFDYTTHGIYGVPSVNWTIDGFQVAGGSKDKLRFTFYTDGKYQICVNIGHCKGTEKVCDSIHVVTADQQVKLNFKASTTYTTSLGSVVLTPLTDNANRFVWTITPKSFTLLNPPALPSSYDSTSIRYNAAPGDSLPKPRIKFLDTVCYTISLVAYNSLDPGKTSDTLVKTNYICGKDFRDYYPLYGRVWFDLNNDCQVSSGEPGAMNIPVKLYDSINQFIGFTYTQKDGIFGMDMPNGTYKLVMNTNGFPVKVRCTTGNDTIVKLYNKNFNGVNFALECLAKKDLGVKGFRTENIVFPGRTHTLKVYVGSHNDMCKQSSVSGKVIVKIAGKVSYVGISKGAITPSSVSGMVFTYQIADFNQVNKWEDFALDFKIDTSAQSTDSIMVKVEIIPNQQDADSTNNKGDYFYRVRNSLDPNMKEVYPENVPEYYNDWLNYTVHFQNTGDAPAYNIRLEDTLDNRLDLESLEVMEASHSNKVFLKGSILTFYFNDIILPDSTTDRKGSEGFVQYRIKPKSGLASGTRLSNTAYIYFDYNPAVVTNTTVNEYMVPGNTGVSTLKDLGLNIYPNPGTGIFYIRSLEGNVRIEVYNTMGVLLMSELPDVSGRVDLSKYPDGMYIFKIHTGGQVKAIKILKYQSNP